VKIKEEAGYSRGRDLEKVEKKNEILEDELWKEKVVMDSIMLPRRMYRWV